MGRRKQPATTHGIAVVDKPAGVTSHDVVAMLRRRFDERQVGHGGTLDPSATGVLVVAVGKATKLLRFVEKTSKAYVGEVVFGTETDTLDADGEVTATHEMGAIDLAAAQAAVDEHLSATSSRFRRWCRRSRSTASGCTSSLARARRSIGRRGRSRSTRSSSCRPTIRACCSRQSSAAREPTSGPSRPTWVICWVVAPTSATCAALRWVASRSVRRRRPTSAAAAGRGGRAHARPGRAPGRLADVVANGRVLPAWDGEGPWALFGPDGALLAVYERYGATEAKPMVVVPQT